MSELGLLIGELLGGLVPPAGFRAANRRRLASGHVRCALRAASGRVEGMGTEWSSGIAELSPGRILFRPKVGVVGDRVIAVQTITGSDLPPRERPTLPAGDAAILAVETPSGTLLWAVPEHIASRIRELIA